MIYNDRLGDQTDQNEYNQSSQIGNISELNSDFFLDSINNNSSQKSSDQQMGLIQLENLVNELKKENFSLKMKIFFYEDGMKYIEDNDDDTESTKGHSSSRIINSQESNEFIIKYQKMEQDLVTLQKLLEKEKSDNAKLQEDRQNLFKTYEAVEQQLNLLRQRSDKSLEKDSEFSQQYHQLELDYRELQQNFKEVTDLLEQEKNEKEDLVVSNNDLEQYCAEIQQQKNDLEKKYGDLHNEYLLCSQEVKKNKNELHNSLEMQKEVENLKNQEIDFCHKQIEALRKELSDSEDKIESLKKDVQHSQETIKQLNEIKNTLTEKNIRVTENLKDTNEELQNEFKKNKQLQEDISKLKQNDNKFEMISLQSDLDRITKEASKLRVELQKSKVNHEELSEEYETLKETYEDQMSLINKYELEIDKKNNIINDNTKKNRKIKSSSIST